MPAAVLLTAWFVAEFHKYVLIKPITPNNRSTFPNIEITPKSGVLSNSATVQSSIHNFVARLRPLIKEFLSNPRLPVWVPPGDVDESTRRFYHSLAIPGVGNNRPSLLLHDLGNRSNPNADRLFQTNDNHR
jgi:hypothetical protein